MLDDCLLCDIASTHSDGSDSVVFRNNAGVVSVLPGYEVPGWLVIYPASHRVGLVELSDSELSGVAFLSRAVARALDQRLAPERIYWTSFSENQVHFHTVVAAVPHEVPKSQRGPQLFLNAKEFLNQPHALDVAADVARSLAKYKM